MISTNRLRRPNAQMLHSQVALELAVTCLAVVAAAALLRALVLGAGIAGQSWSASFLIVGSQPLVLPLQLLPGGTREVVGRATLADLTTAVLLLILPMFILSQPTRR
ncbi:MAG: hypothetical protein H0U10_04735 [Chloroflexia bacterium]|nr:hypothetical protein [Chloroflexia bacterium]